jgi:hypothetical protein
MATFVERVLITLNEDGTLKGAAQYKLTKGDDELGVPDRQHDAEGIDANALQAVLPNADLTAQVQKLTNERDALQTERDALKDKLREQDKDAPITRAQFVAGTDQNGLLDGLNAFFAGLADDAPLPDGSTGKDAKLRWATAQYFSPTEPMLVSIAAQPPFSLSQDDIYAMFQWARENG